MTRRPTVNKKKSLLDIGIYTKNFHSSYRCWLISEKEWFVSQNVRQHFDVSFTEFLDFFWLVYADALGFNFFDTLEPLNMRQSSTKQTHTHKRK